MSSHRFFCERIFSGVNLCKNIVLIVLFVGRIIEFQIIDAHNTIFVNLKALFLVEIIVLAKLPELIRTPPPATTLKKFDAERKFYFMSLFRKEDYILRQIEAIGRLLKKIFDENRKTTNDMTSVIGDNNEICSDALYQHMLDKYIDENNINEAENYLFSLLESQHNLQLLEVVYWFYSKLAVIPEEKLEAADFSLEEIAEGLNAALDFFPEVPKIVIEG